MDDGRRVFITGGTKGLGRALAVEFARAGSAVFITGRDAGTARITAEGIAAETGGTCHSGGGDACSWEDTLRLAAEAVAAMGGIDIWINNAGVPQGIGMVWDLEPGDLDRVVRTDLLAPMLGAKAAFAAMRDTGGWLWFVEGHGSDGRVMTGLSAYGAAKRGLGYLWRALAAEARASGSRVKVGALSPGIMITDFTMGPMASQEPGRRARNLAVFNILADRPETVAAYAVPRMLAATRSGTLLAWLTTPKAAWRFATAGLTRRRVVEG